jgi:hypothetical protein
MDLTPLDPDLAGGGNGSLCACDRHIDAEGEAGYSRLLRWGSAVIGIGGERGGVDQSSATTAQPFVAVSSNAGTDAALVNPEGC